MVIQASVEFLDLVAIVEYQDLVDTQEQAASVDSAATQVLLV